MVYSITYRRPRHMKLPVNRRESSGSEEGRSSMRSESTAVSSGIPDALSFEKIVDGGTCPPCTVRDFMNYLLYVEHAPENLQFYLWLRSYTKRFEEANTPDMPLARKWTDAMQDTAIEEAISNAKSPRAIVSPTANPIASMFKGTDCTVANKPTGCNPFDDPPMSEKQGGSSKPGDTSMKKIWVNSTNNSNDGSILTRSAESYQATASDAFSGAGLKQPFTIQPFREEVNRVIATYMVKDSPRELNLSGRERYALLKAAQYTTHPSVFNAVKATTESSLRRQAHPNFIRWTICNGNRPRVIFARGLGIVTLIFGFLVAVLFNLSSSPSGLRAIAAILWVIGFATLFAAYKGMCVVLHGLHHRHLRPWELFEDAEVDLGKSYDFDSGTPRVSMKKSYEEEPWVVKYRQRNVIRKIFDKEVWVQEPALRQIQDTIFLQAILSSAVFGGIFTAVFVVLPTGGFY